MERLDHTLSSIPGIVGAITLVHSGPYPGLMRAQGRFLEVAKGMGPVHSVSLTLVHALRRWDDDTDTPLCDADPV